MAQVLVRDVEPVVVDRLKQRAKKSGRSLEAELRLILEQAAQSKPEDALAAALRVRALFAGQTFSDSAALLREDRDSAALMQEDPAKEDRQR